MTDESHQQLTELTAGLSVDVDRQLDQLSDEQMLDAINRREQRKAAAASTQADQRRREHRRKSLELTRSEVKRRFGNTLTGDLPSPDTNAAAGRAEAARRFRKEDQ